MTITVREMTLADLPGVVACQTEAFGHPYDPAVVEYEFQGCHRFNPDGLQVAVTPDAEIVGTIWGAWNGRRAVISGLSVRSDHQGEGLARRLIETVAENFQRKGVTRFSLEIVESNQRVIPLYEHLGFRVKQGLITMGTNLNNEDGTPLNS